MGSIGIKPLLTSLLFLLCLEVLYFFPGFLLWGGFIVLVMMVASVLWIMKGDWETGIIRRSMLPVMLAIGILSFGFFMPVVIFKQIAILMSTVCMYALLVYVDQFPYKNFLITRLNFSFVSLVIAYYLFYSIAHISVSFVVPIWVIMTLVLMVSFSLFYTLLWATGLSRNLVVLYTVLFGFLISEIFLIVSFWPVDPSAKSIVLVVALYMFWGMLSHWLEKVLTKRVALEYIFIGVFLMALVLVMSSWLPPFLI